MKGNVILFLLQYTFLDMTVFCLFAKQKVICRLFWGCINYDPSNVIPVEISNCSASIRRNMVTPVCSLSTLCDSALWFGAMYMSELFVRY